jgi:hypothetical protein
MMHAVLRNAKGVLAYFAPPFSSWKGFADALFS